MFNIREYLIYKFFYFERSDSNDAIKTIWTIG